jgi:O-antigen/teichoic acid export membrane protein
MSVIEPETTQQSMPSRPAPMEQKPLHFRVVRGAAFSIIRKVIIAPISLLLVPFTLHKVGAAGYGTWTILVTLINLTWLMDPGLSPTVTKYVAEHSGTDDINELRRVMDASCALAMFLAGCATFVFWFFSHAIIGQLFRGPDAPTQSEMLLLWPLVLLSVGALLMTTPFTAFINGRQRMDLTNVLLFSSEVFGVLCTVVFLLAGAKVYGLALAVFLNYLFLLIGGIIIARRLLPSVMPNPFRCKLTTMRKMISFSVPLYAGYLMYTLQGHVEKLYLARFVGIVPVGWYNVASEGAAKVKRVPDLLLGPVLAAASELDATKERRKVEELYFRSQKYLAVVAIPLVVFAVVTAKTLIGVWVGKSLVPVAIPFALLVIGNLFPQIGAPTYFVLVGRGILRPAVYTALIATVLNVVLSFVFIKEWGFAGAVYGTALPMIISTVYFLAATRPYFELPLRRMLLRAYLKPLLCSLAAVPLVVLVGSLKLRMWPSVLLELLAFALVYFAGIVLTRFFDDFDLSKAESHLPFLRMARRVIPAS